MEEIKDLIGDDLKGEQGSPGINGKEVEFRTFGGYIQWRYVDNSQEDDANWENLVLLSALKGESGQSGTKGNDGETPYIGENDNWWIGTEDTGVKAEGLDGQTPTIEISSDGYWVINNVKQSVKAVGTNGETPYIGSNGNWWIGHTDTKVTAQVVVTFDYNNLAFLENIGINVYDYVNIKKTQQKITLAAWLDDLMPNFSDTEFEKYFQGWFISDTNKEITKYDLIGGNITLKAKWNEENLEKYYNEGATFTYNNCSYTAYLLNEQDRIVIPKYYNDGVNGEYSVTCVNKADIEDYGQTSLTCLYLSNNVNELERRHFIIVKIFNQYKFPITYHI